MLVGHNPMIEQLLCNLVGDEAAREALPDGYPPAGLAILDLPSDATSARLVSLLLPTP